MNIHCIGVGKMGLPMARHMAARGRALGHTLSVSDTSAEQLAEAARAGLEVVSAQAAGVADAVMAGADCIVSSLPDDRALLAVADRVARHARRGALFIDTSTVSPSASAEVAVALQAAGVDYLRCTVSGNAHMAEAATLTVLASGPRSAFDAALPLLEAWGPNRFYLGEAEQARLMKLIVNLMVAQTTAMLGEALALGERGGLDWGDMWDVLTASAVASPILKAKAVPLRVRDFCATFTVQQMQKDVGLILSEARRTGVALPQTALTAAALAEADAAGWGAEDYAAILKLAAR